MEKFLKRKLPSSRDDVIGSESSTRNTTHNISRPASTSTPTMPVLVDLDNLPWDPADRKRILEYHPNQRDEIRRKYWLRGPCQPRGHKFPKRVIGNQERAFSPNWFNKYGNWLEYSIKLDKVFCLCCYLCRDFIVNQSGSDAYVTQGFNSWNKTERLKSHVGDINSFHNRALKNCEDLMKPNQSIGVALHKQDDIVKNANRIRLNATIDACRYCLKCALAFRRHDVKKTSLFKGNFLELMDLILSQNEELRKLPKAAGNNQYLAPSIQKDIATCFKVEVLQDMAPRHFGSGFNGEFYKKKTSRV
uniref:uncharacterized protein LOC122586770 n=1 Tax=Erigeron canadensis TaxID=72917 RepID=UPI001CB8BC04|nr:uncharacterized protein LOC122586770 [Erigeron canadensis]